jgi:Flp pilus assembly protein TadD
MLQDPIRSVQIEAARILAVVPSDALTETEEMARRKALEQYRQGLLAQGDQAGAHMALGVLAERRNQWGEAAESYRTAIRIQPHVTGPRSNLAAVLEHTDRGQDEARRLRRQEMELLRRDVSLAPDSAGLQYRLGLSLYLHQHTTEAEEALKKACDLEPLVPEFRMGLALLYEKLERWDEALACAEKLVDLRPEDPVYNRLLQKYRAVGNAGRAADDP